MKDLKPPRFVSSAVACKTEQLDQQAPGLREKKAIFDPMQIAYFLYFHRWP